ncbi:LysR substrate-binding domain-containing protein [Devosia pacifica]|uniref:LysR substrate-binding domain-containing protein n=1 Tax=Devosia pacifica TaxID=1335967 RepID=UPI00167731F7|nr:LysR substrate-binding domain-containing protein [Devosia pacifica]
MAEHFSSLDLNLLEVFEAVYLLRNMTRAAERLRVSQPTVSNAVARLRTSLNDPLFVRQARGIVPTAKADELIGPVQRALADMRSALQPGAAFNPAKSRREFKLMVVDALERIVMPALVRDAAQNDQISFRLVLSAATSIEAALEEGLIDLAVNVPAPTHRDFRWEVLAPLDVVVVARKGHPQIDGAITREQLQTLPHIALDMTPGAMANAHLVNLTSRLERKDAVLVSRVGSILELAATTDLVGFASRLHAQTCPDADRLQIIEPPFPLSTQNFHMTWHKRTSEDGALLWLRERIQIALQSLQPHI